MLKAYKSRFHTLAAGSDIVQMAVLFVLIFSVYAWTAPRSVVFEDDGIFIMAAWFNGISHPPGYPLYTLLAHLATYLPVGSIAWRVHILSGLFGALSCLCIWWLVFYWLRDRFYAATAALLYAFSATFWSQAIISEVYTLNVFIFLILCILAVRWEYLRKTGHSVSILCWIGFIYGLGLSNHWPLLILSTPMLLAFMWHCLGMPVREFTRPGLILLVGLTPYAWMVFRSQMDPEISFYGPIESLQEFWFYISRKGYANQDVQTGADLIDKLHFLLFTFQEGARQFACIPAVLIPVGLVSQWRYFNRNICIGLILGFLGSTLLLIMLLGFNYVQLNKNVFKVYPLIAWAVLVIWLVAGLRYTVEKITNALAGRANPALLKSGIICLVVVPVFVTNLPLNYRAGDRLAENLARTLLESLDKNAVFITYADVETGPVGYMHMVENLRPDILLLNAGGFIFQNRLFKGTLNIDDKYEILSDYLQHEDRPVYYIRGIPNIYGYQDYGLYFRMDNSMPPNTAVFVADKRITRFFQKLLLTRDLIDPWEYMAQRILLSDYCRISTRYYLNEAENLNIEDLQKICRGFYGIITMVEILYSDGYTDTDFLRQQLDRARLIREQAIDVDILARLEYLYGQLALKDGDESGALAFFKRSMEIWPGKKNEAAGMIRQLQTQRR